MIRLIGYSRFRISSRIIVTFISIILNSLAGSLTANAESVLHCDPNVNIISEGKFVCSPAQNGYVWKIKQEAFSHQNWNFAEENELRRNVKPKNLCVVESGDFAQCLEIFRTRPVLVIGDSQVDSALNILSFLPLPLPVIVSSLPGCPPLDFRRITVNSIYDDSCRLGAKQRISQEIYKRVSSVIIVSGGRYTVKEFNAYISALKSIGIRNILFLGPYIRSEIPMSQYVQKFKTEVTITSNYEYSSEILWKKFAPNDQDYSPNYFDSVVKKHRILSINPFAAFCRESCPIFIDNHPLLLDTHHWTFNFALQLFQSSNRALQKFFSL
jgi:hypothetical protein